MKILLLTLLAFSAQAFAAGGDRVGNGGDVVVCGDRVELLDLYEARVKGHKPLTLESDTHEEMLKEVIERRIQQLQPLRAKRFRDYGEEFFKESIILPGIELSDVDDAGLAVIPRGCKLEQIVIQLSDADIPPGGHRYTISQDLWEKLDEFNKMALMLHEVIYREAIYWESRRMGTARSMIVRALVGEILRNEIDEGLFLRLTMTGGPTNRTLELFKFSIVSENLRIRRVSQNQFRLEAPHSFNVCVEVLRDRRCTSINRINVTPMGFESDSGATSRFVGAGEAVEIHNFRVTLDVPSFYNQENLQLLPLEEAKRMLQVLGAAPASFILSRVWGFGSSRPSSDGAIYSSGFDISSGRIGDLQIGTISDATVFVNSMGVRVASQKQFIVSAGGFDFQAEGVSLETKKVYFWNSAFVGTGHLELRLFDRFSIPVRPSGNFSFELGDIPRTLSARNPEVLEDVVLRPASGRNRPAIVLKKGTYDLYQTSDRATFYVNSSNENRQVYYVYSSGRVEYSP